MAFSDEKTTHELHILGILVVLDCFCYSDEHHSQKQHGEKGFIWLLPPGHSLPFRGVLARAHAEAEPRILLCFFLSILSFVAEACF